MITADDLITKITEAPDYVSACEVLIGVSRAMLAELCDLLYIEDFECSGYPSIKRAIIAEVRS